MTIIQLTVDASLCVALKEIFRQLLTLKNMKFWNSRLTYWFIQLWIWQWNCFVQKFIQQKREKDNEYKTHYYIQIEKKIENSFICMVFCLNSADILIWDNFTKHHTCLKKFSPLQLRFIYNFSNNCVG